MISRDAILERVRNLPTLSTAALRLSTLLNDESSSAVQFEQVIRPDPALTANLLRITNSAYFGLRREVTSVRQAVTLLGLERLFEVAAGAAFRQVIPERIPGYQISACSFWKHCVAVAMLSERLAVEIGIEIPDLTFTAGLLHDVGKLAIGSFLVAQTERVHQHLQVSGALFIQAERDVLGYDHSEVGAEVAEHWNLPAALHAPIRYHHRPDDAPESVDRQLVDLVHTADCLAHSLGFGTDVGELARRVEPTSTGRLGLKVQRLEHAACETADQIREMGDLLAQSPGGQS